MREFFPLLRHHTDPQVYEQIPPVPWWLVEASADQCQRNHRQTPQRLADRGGLSPRELYHVLRGEEFVYRQADRPDPFTIVRYLRAQCQRANPAGASSHNKGVS